MTSWNGTWRNQYGSIVVIEDDGDGIIRGVFRTALEDSFFFGQGSRSTGPLMAMSSASRPPAMGRPDRLRSAIRGSSGTASSRLSGTRSPTGP
jgi:hypothetical protein